MRHPPPPPRYRIYERDRRLVVVDSWSIDAEQPELTPAPTEVVRPRRQTQIAFDGRAAFTTHRLFDAKAPRTLVLDPGSAATIERLKLAVGVIVAIMVFIAVTVPWLLLPLLFVLQRKPRERIRAAITAWLDRAGSQMP